MAQGPSITTAIVELAKLRDYSLNENHVRGRHKARVFRSRLGLTAADAMWLQRTLETAATQRLQELIPADSDVFGDRFVLDILVELRGRTAMVRCAWIVRQGEEMVRLTTRYIL